MVWLAFHDPCLHAWKVRSVIRVDHKERQCFPSTFLKWLSYLIFFGSINGQEVLKLVFLKKVHLSSWHIEDQIIFLRLKEREKPHQDGSLTFSLHIPIRVWTEHTYISVYLRVKVREVNRVPCVLPFCVLVLVHLAVSLHVAEKHQLYRVKANFIWTPLTQEATNFVETYIDLVVEGNQISGKDVHYVVETYVYLPSIL